MEPRSGMDLIELYAEENNAICSLRHRWSGVTRNRAQRRQLLGGQVESDATQIN